MSDDDAREEVLSPCVLTLGGKETYKSHRRMFLRYLTCCCRPTYYPIRLPVALPGFFAKLTGGAAILGLAGYDHVAMR